MKRDKTEVPEDLSDADKQRLAFWVRDRWPHLFNPHDLRRLVDACLAWHGARNNPGNIVSWYRACQTWIIRDQEFAARNARYGTPERPQETRDEAYVTSDMIPVADAFANVLPLFARKDRK